MLDANEIEALDKKLAERENVLKKAQAISRLGYWKYIPSTGEIDGSEELFILFGLNKDESSSEALFSLIHPDDVALVDTALQRCAEYGERVDVNYRVLRRDGSQIWLRGVAEAVTVDSGEIVYLVGTTQDITDIVATNKALRESELWMKSIFNSLDEAVLVVSPDRELINVNNAAVSMFGYSIEEIFNNSTELFHVDHQHFLEFGERIRQAFAENKVAKFEFEAKRKNGEIFPTEHTVSLLKDAVGEIKGIVSVVKDITEARLVKDELEQNKARFEAMFESIPDAIVYTGPDRKIQLINNATRKMFSYEESELLGNQTIMLYASPDDFEWTGSERFNPDAKTSEFSEPYVVDYKCKNGRVFQGETIGVPVSASSGGVMGYLGIVRDITERKKTEEELAHVQGMLKKGNAIARMGAWSFDLLSNELEWSDITKEIHEVDADYKPEIDTAINFYKEGVSRDTINRIVRDAMENGGSWDEELIIVTAKGNERWVRAMGQPEFKDGVCVRLYGSFQDISERKRAEQEFERMFELSPDLLGIGNLEGYFTRVNSSFEKMLGYSEDEFLSKTFIDFIYEDDVQVTLNALNDALNGKRDIFVVNRYKCKDGSIKWIEWDILALKEENKFYATGRDVTERKAYEAELEKYHNNLEELVADRTRELEKSLAEKEVLLKEVHHRVKNNMAMVSAFIRVQMGKAEDTSSKKALKACENRILAMSMVHKRLYQSDDFTSISMKVLFEEICGALYRKSEFNNIDLDIRCDNVSLEMDYAIPCAMIVNELVSNSLKHAFGCGKPGTIAIHMNSEGDNVYRLRVSDNGEGVSEAISLENTDTLGLQLVNVFVDQLKGKVNIFRNEGFAVEIVFSTENSAD